MTINCLRKTLLADGDSLAAVVVSLGASDEKKNRNNASKCRPLLVEDSLGRLSSKDQRRTLRRGKRDRCRAPLNASSTLKSVDASQHRRLQSGRVQEICRPNQEQTVFDSLVDPTSLSYSDSHTTLHHDARRGDILASLTNFSIGRRCIQKLARKKCEPSLRPVRTKLIATTSMQNTAADSLSVKCNNKRSQRLREKQKTDHREGQNVGLCSLFLDWRLNSGFLHNEGNKSKQANEYSETKADASASRSVARAPAEMSTSTLLIDSSPSHPVLVTFIDHQQPEIPSIIVTTATSHVTEKRPVSSPSLSLFDPVQQSPNCFESPISLRASKRAAGKPVPSPVVTSIRKRCDRKTTPGKSSIKTVIQEFASPGTSNAKTLQENLSTISANELSETNADVVRAPAEMSTNTLLIDSSPSHPVVTFIDHQQSEIPSIIVTTGKSHVTGKLSASSPSLSLVDPIQQPPNCLQSPVSLRVSNRTAGKPVPSPVVTSIRKRCDRKTTPGKPEVLSSSQEVIPEFASPEKSNAEILQEKLSTSSEATPYQDYYLSQHQEFQKSEETVVSSEQIASTILNDSREPYLEIVPGGEPQNSALSLSSTLTYTRSNILPHEASITEVPDNAVSKRRPSRKSRKLYIEKHQSENECLPALRRSERTRTAPDRLLDERGSIPTSQEVIALSLDDLRGVSENDVAHNGQSLAKPNGSVSLCQRGERFHLSTVKVLVEDPDAGEGFTALIRRSGRTRTQPQRFGNYSSSPPDQEEEGVPVPSVRPLDPLTKDLGSHDQGLSIVKSAPHESRNEPVSDHCEFLDDWSQTQLETLKKAHSSVNPLAPTFWADVAVLVAGKSASECREKWFTLTMTPLPRKVHSKSVQPIAIAKTRFEEDDIFNATPMRELLETMGGDYGKSAFPEHVELGSAIKIEYKPENELQFQPKVGYKSYIDNMRRDVNRSRRNCKPKKRMEDKGAVPRAIQAVSDGDVEMNVRLTPGGTLNVKTGDYEMEVSDFLDEMTDEDE